jgi:cyclophilin family peptidyl-prolyl cis-trans isomerase
MNRTRLWGTIFILALGVFGVGARVRWPEPTFVAVPAVEVTDVRNSNLQDDEEEPASVNDQYLRDDARLAAMSVEELQAELKKVLADWRQQHSRVGQAVMQFHSEKEEQAPKWASQFRDAKRKGEAARKLAGQVAMHLLEKMTGPPDKDLADLAFHSIDAYFMFHEYSKAYRMAKALVERGHQRPYLLPLYGHAAYCVNQLTEARAIFSEAKVAGETLTADQDAAFDACQKLRTTMEAEQAALLKDQESNLPRIEFQTTKGTIVVELFEDHAPNTVNNIVFLVEQGFFKNRQFYEVSDSMAVTGSTTNDPYGQAGYWIKSEHDLPNRRPHLRGYLTMLVDVQAELASSQFAFVTRPRPDLDEQLNTVFGRVIEGDVVLDNLERAGTQWQEMIKAQDSMIGQPDQIISARVIRKRDKDYVPERVER